MKNPEGHTTKKLIIFITVDTEDNYFEVPRLITGEGLDNNPGISMIIDKLNQYNYKANFFLNVYEHLNYEAGCLKNIARQINNEGHEVELHSHPNNRLDFYYKPLFRYSLEDQIKILEYGKNLICDWTGKNPVAYRGGGYAFNENTLIALSKIGIPIDSSLWYKNRNNMINANFTVNRIAAYNNTIEVPVIYVNCLKSDGTCSDSKFDIDWLTSDELIQVIQQSKEHNLKALTLFMHSFSFIDKETKPVIEAKNPRSIFVSNPCLNNYTEIYGTDEKDIKKLDRVLKYISEDKDIEVLSFKDWYKNRKFNLNQGEDFIPIINR